MSDTRSPSQVPTPSEDGASGAGTGRSTGGQDRNPAPRPMPQHAQEPDEGPGEITLWGYQAYRDPEPPAPAAGVPYPSAQPSSPAYEAGVPFPSAPPSFPVEAGTPSPGTRPPAIAEPNVSRPADRPPAASDPGSPYRNTFGPEAHEAGAHRSAAREARPPYSETWASHPAPPAPDPGALHGDTRAPYGAPQAPAPGRPANTASSAVPGGGPLSPLDPAWTPTPQGPNRDRGPSQDRGWAERDAAQAQPWPSAAPPEQPGPPRSPDASERPFSYWENSNWGESGGESSGREAAPASRQPYGGQPAPTSLEDYTRHSAPHALEDYGREPHLSRRGRPWQPEQEPEPRPEEEPAAPPVKKKREPYLDNVKFILIALVVTGHSLVPTLAAHSAKSAYLFIYTFHMPAFVLLSGYLGRNFWNSNAKINKLVDTMLVPYAFIEIGYTLLRYALGQKWTLTIIDPAWLNWYLVALVLWRISTPIWNRMRQPLLVAVTIYMMAGFSEISGDFSLDRFFGLLPFYVLGLLLKPEHFDLLKPVWVKITAGVVIAAAVAAAIYIAPRVGLDPVYYRYSFKYMHISWWMGLIVRAAMLLAGLTLSVALLALVPRRETWFSDLGTRTLYAYLLHGVVVLIAKDQGWLSFPWLYGPLGVLAITSCALVLAIVLCLPQTRTLFKWLLEPRLVWLYRRPADTTPDRSGRATPDRESSAAVPR